MAGESMSRWQKIRAATQNFFEEKGIESDAPFAQTGFRRVAHFWLLVGKSFIRNRGPVRASALAYTTLLALVPLLAVGLSITTSMLQTQGDEPARKLINKLIDYVAPALDLEEREAEFEEPEPPKTSLIVPIVPTNELSALTNRLALTNVTAATTNAPAKISGRERVVEQITSFIGNIKTKSLGMTAILALLFVAISMLRTIEAAFNDIWGVTQGRGWIKSIVYYWAAITLGPLFLVGALTLTTRTQIASTRAWLDHVPFLGSVMFHALPFIILSLGFAAFYALMPNTKVHFRAALVGGTIGGCLWQLNNILSVLYVSRVTTYTNVYGGLAVIPLFLVGMYFSWVIMLFGAQVAYAFQNRRAYIQEKQAESVNQRGREFVALRLMTHIARNFIAGEKPLSMVQLSRQLGVPSQLSHKILCTLVQSGLLVEVLDNDIRFSPGRPLDRINAYHVLCALRAGSGTELATAEDESRTLVRSEFERMMLAEREAGSATTLQSLAELTAKQVGNAPRTVLEAARD